MEDQEFDIGAAVDESFAAMGDDTGGDGGVVDTTATDVTGQEKDVTELTPADAGTDSALAAKPDQTTLNTAGEIEVPKTWRKEAAAHWAALPPEVRAEVQKREEDMFRGLEVYKSDAAVGKAFNQVLQPHQDLMRQHNVNPGQLIGSLLHAQRTLSFGTPQEKAQFINNIVQQYGIDLAGADQTAYVDPTVQRLQIDFQRLQSQLSAQQQASANAEMEKQKAAVDSFATDPKNVYFSEVANDMVTLIEKGVCGTMQEAYEKAIWANPAVRQKEIARQQAEAVAQKNAAAAAQAAKARQATAANVHTSARRGSAAAPVGSIDDTLAQAFAEITNRA